ncbi:hypothetical protein FGG08_006584 [Glutinoglossum americanum]|uniref:Uncharacterized protein n=1 Tax=Glutinoglossum americanum TaxID=1670608 RepID=A0A9P8I361_9PEZI|nr:hypothetical protein FGG08_006584 [Glutinoglossum americanum]
MRFLLLALSLVLIVSASETFNPNCTIPPKSINLVTSPAVRGTFDILWSSLFTLLICTWTIQHLNIPAPKPKEIETCWGGVKGLFAGKGGRPLLSALVWSIRSRAWPRLMWMIITLILPELLVGLAFQNLMKAIESCRLMKPYAREDGVEWTLTHAFFANMGGFVLKVKSLPSEPDSAPGPDSNPLESQREDDSGKTPDLSGRLEGSAENPDPNSITSGEADDQASPPATEQTPNPSGSDRVTPRNLEKGSNSARAPEDEPLYYLTAEELYYARRRGNISKLPNASTEEIEDKSKGDFFIKGTAVVQVVWLLVQVVVRTARGLPISQLEIAVLAFSVCAFITYLLCWMKPQNVLVPIQISGSGDFLYGPAYHSWFGATLSWAGSGMQSRTVPIPNDAESRGNFTLFGPLRYMTFVDDGIVCSGVIFGALHCLAWDFHFPHPSERLLWRISAVVSVASLPAFYLCFWIFLSSQRRGFVLTPLILAYVLARLYLLVEAFRTLCFLEPGSFISTWTTQFPHVG